MSANTASSSSRTLATEALQPSEGAKPDMKQESDVESQQLESGNVDSSLATLSMGKKMILLIVFSLAQFVDIMSVSSCFIATSAIAEETDLGLESSAWIITSYSLTFASFLLLSGRLADLYSPQKLFLTGFLGLGIISIGISFATNKYAFLVLRAVSGIFGSLTIPSAINIIIHLFPNPADQQKYLGIFQLSGAVGNIIGVLFAGILMLASWKWIYRFIAIVVIPLTTLAWYLLQAAPSHKRDSTSSPRWKKLDVLGSLIILITLILFILSLTEGNIKGWRSAGFLAPFFISVVGFPAFFIYESRLPLDMAILPSSTWKIPNFFVWGIVALIPYAVWAASQTQLSTFSQSALGHSAILSAVRVLPQGIAGLAFGMLATAVPSVLSRPKYTVILGLILAAVGIILIAESNGGGGKHYWRFLFPGFIILSFGAMMAYLSATVGLIMSTPPEMAGVSGAWFNVILQVGAVIALSIQQGLFGSFSGADITVWRGSQYSFWMLLAFTGVILILFVSLYRSPKVVDEETPQLDSNASAQS